MGEPTPAQDSPNRIKIPEPGRLKEPRSVSETAIIVNEMINGMDPKLGAFFIRPDAILAVAGIKGASDSLHINVDNKADILKQIDDLNNRLAKYGIFVGANRRVDQPDVSLSIGWSALGLEYKSSRFNSLRKLGLTQFDSSTGIKGAIEWLNETDDLLGQVVEKKLIIEDEKEIYSQGIRLGYPDKAMEDFVQWDKNERREDLVEADILSVHPLAQKYGEGITPEFDYRQSSANDPEIVENILNSRRILHGVYEHSLIKQAVARLNK